MYRRWLLMFVTVVASLAGCGKTEVTPTFEITKGEVTVHSYGGSNYALRYDFDYRAESGRDAIDIIEINDGKFSSPISFRGSLVGHSSLFLAGSFRIDGDTSRLDELKHTIKFGPLQMDFHDKTEVVLVEYMDLNGKKVRYVVRSVEKP